jgi:hypothetical protein
VNDKDLTIYFDILKNKTFKEADEFKNTLLPKKIYKYIWLSDDESENEKRFKALELDEIWCSRYTTLNDPFEFSAIYIDTEKMKKKGYGERFINQVVEFYKKTKDILRICSFSGLLNNMPMWAHYANNHKGFCIEYEISNGDKVFPIIYTKTRKEEHEFFIELIDTQKKIIHSEGRNGYVHEDDFLKSLGHISYMYIANATKHYSWSYEKEYRVIFSKVIPDEKNGELIACNDSGLKTKKVYIGKECKEEHIKRLQEICLNLNLEVPMQMSITTLNPNYELKPCQLK